jgi:hypothetical protein
VGHDHPVMPESELPSKSFTTTPCAAAARLDSTVANQWSMDCVSVTRQALADHDQENETLFKLDAAVDQKNAQS